MISVFIALYFIKTILGNKKCIHESAIYRTNNDEEEFRELTYKRFIASQEPLITTLETNSIVLIVGCYVFQDTEYLTLVQTIPISTSTDEIEITSDNLSNSLPLLLYSVSIVFNSYFSDNEFASDIEWNYAGTEQFFNNSNKEKAKAQDDINNHLKKTNLLPTSSSKTQRTLFEPQNDKLQPDNHKNNNSQNDKPQINNLLNAISQIKNTGSQSQKDVE
ncbi:30849_t:CDS:2 [Gigaspora margarita]|uniref:30849_t:CDS:1 n=1 Tax=Gigaspora margarita TaxID=4874 RepID=A0ABN7W4I1_GIGMA|nr:30849_t:CDS:2 [Gigaspora margarita]